MQAGIGHAAPGACLLPGTVLTVMRLVMLPKLQAVMTDEDIIAASEMKQPALDRMRVITCRGCHVRCPLVIPTVSPLRDLMTGQYMERIEKADRLLEELLPVAKRAELERQGVKCSANHMPSRKNPQLWFIFEKDGQKKRIYCEVGRCIVRTDDGEENFHSVARLGELIREAASILLGADIDSTSPKEVSTEMGRKDLLTEVISLVAEGNYGVMAGITSAFTQLSVQEINALCLNELKGEALWLAFKARRDDSATPEDYSFREFIKEIAAAKKQ